MPQLYDCVKLCASLLDQQIAGCGESMSYSRPVDAEDSMARRAVTPPAPPKRRPGRPKGTGSGVRKTASTFRLPPEYWRRCRIAAAIHDTTVVNIVQQALDAWFLAHPLPPGIEGV
jgi:hypothetical protein